MTTKQNPTMNVATHVDATASSTDVAGLEPLSELRESRLALDSLHEHFAQGPMDYCYESLEFDQEFVLSWNTPHNRSTMSLFAFIDEEGFGATFIRISNGAKAVSTHFETAKKFSAFVEQQISSDKNANTPHFTVLAIGAFESVNDF